MFTGPVGDANALFWSSFEDLVAAKVFLSECLAQPVTVGEEVHLVGPYLIGNAAFPLQMQKIKLYAGTNLGDKELAFNGNVVKAAH